jgi:hypothetical protein
MTVADAEALQLLRLIKKYADEYGIEEGMTVSELVDDLAMSMDNTSDEADEIRRQLGD